MTRAALVLTALLVALSISGACDSSGSGDPSDALAADALATDATPVDSAAPPADTVAASGAFGCGASSTCGADEACASRGQGACLGPAPDESGHCGPDCYAYDCGGSEHCLCDTFWCVDLPSHCTSCSCATAPDASCTCDDSDGHVRFSCMGA